MQLRMLNITKNAKAAITDRHQRLWQVGPYIRIGIKDAGCSGFEYTFEYESKIRENDRVVNCIVVGEAAQPFLEGSTLDWVKEGVNERFKIINPNESSQCGCGVSVQF